MKKKSENEKLRNKNTANRNFSKITAAIGHFRYTPAAKRKKKKNIELTLVRVKKKKKLITIELIFKMYLK